MRLFHIVSATDWAAAVVEGSYEPASVAAEGFIHFSFADQVAGTANRYYRALDGLQVIELESRTLDVPLRIEDTTGSGTEFPHVYGPVAASAVLAIHPLERDDNGDYVFSPDV
jgi:uncharacterized protein (DUF952 family)